MLTSPVDHAALKWIKAHAPDAAQRAYLQETLQLPQSFITHALDMGEPAHTERTEGQTLLILRIPYKQQGTADVPFIAVPLALIFSKEFVITLCPVKTDILEHLSTTTDTIANTTTFILQVLMAIVSAYLVDLRQINQLVDAAEERLKASIHNNEVLELLTYQKSLVHFTTALRSNELMMARLQKSQWFVLSDQEREWLEDILVEHHQAVEMVGIAEDILSQMMDAFASIISNNLNKVMELLAAITIILAFPTLIASLYGMNVALPLQGTPAAFWLVLLFSVISSLMVTMFFLKRRWL